MLLYPLFKDLSLPEPKQVDAEDFIEPIKERINSEDSGNSDGQETEESKDGSQQTLAEIEGFSYQDSTQMKSWRHIISRSFINSNYNVQFTLFLIKRDISHKFPSFMELAPSYVDSLPHVSWELIG